MLILRTLISSSGVCNNDIVGMIPLINYVKISARDQRILPWATLRFGDTTI
jgi:hypothetical protein